VKLPLWAIPGLAAIVLTTGSVAAAEGTFSSTRVPLPREVQLHVTGSGMVPAPTMTTTTLEPSGSTPTDQVVAPSRPVVTQSGPSTSTREAVAPGGDSSSPATTVGTPSPDPEGGEGPGGSSAPSASPPTTMAPGYGVVTPTTTSTTTTLPVVPPTTTTTTRPRWGGEGGDE